MMTREIEVIPRILYKRRSDFGDMFPPFDLRVMYPVFDPYDPAVAWGDCTEPTEMTCDEIVAKYRLIDENERRVIYEFEQLERKYPMDLVHILDDNGGLSVPMPPSQARKKMARLNADFPGKSYTLVKVVG